MPNTVAVTAVTEMSEVVVPVAVVTQMSEKDVNNPEVDVTVLSEMSEPSVLPEAVLPIRSKGEIVAILEKFATVAVPEKCAVHLRNL